VSGAVRSSPDRELEAYLPTAAEYGKLRDWLAAQGFKVTLESNSRHAIFAGGTVSRVAAAFRVQMARVSTIDGEFTSAVTPPRCRTNYRELYRVSGVCSLV
jgi:subtilase family serine protease